MVESNLFEILGALRENSRYAVIALDAEGLIRLWNSGAERMLGWTEEELLGKTAPVELQLLVKPGKDGQFTFHGKDGTAIDVDSCTSRWHGGTLAIIAEISKLVRLEQELQEVMAQEKVARRELQTERRFRDLLEAAPDAILEVDREGKIVLLNLVAEKLFGYTREQLLGQPVEILVPDAQRGGHSHHRARYWSHPVTRPMGTGLKLLGQRKDGSTFPVEISLSPVKSEDGFRVTAVIRDITERRQAEDQLRTVQEQYTRELELRNREIERANQLKSEFLASMSHELRTPLHTVIGFAELLAEELEGPLNPKQQRFIEHIHKDSLHLLELINDILDLSKIESGRVQLRRENFDIGAVLEEALSSIRPQGLAKSLAIETDIAVSTAIFADRLRFKQILFNLLSNAVKFTPEGGKIRVEAVMRDDGVLEVSVSDTGVGIPKEQHEAVFDKFYQVGATTKGVREGTGLGLAITQALVEEHGGRVWVESEPGKGSRFTFTIGVEQTK